MRRWVGQAAAAMGIFGLIMATGCGSFFVYPGSQNGGSGSSTGDYMYVANATNQTVAGFTVGTGSLTALSGSPFSVGFAPTAMVVVNSLLFVASGNGISSYSIASNGALTSQSSGVTSGVANVVAMDVSPDGQWLLALDGVPTSNIVTVYGFQINSSTGALSTQTAGGVTYTASYTITAPASPIVAPVPSALKVASVTGGVYVFVALGSGGELIIPFNTSTGVQSTPTQYSLTGGTNYTSDNALAVNNSILYVARSNSTSPGTIAAYNVANGVPSLVGQAATGAQPSSVVIKKDGADVYVANRNDSTISGFSIASGGAPTALGTYSSGLGSLPVGLAVDNSGNYLLDVANGGSPEVTMYSYDSSGNLVFSTSSVSGSGSSGGAAIATTH
jgi:6-phosphogluconolactonase